MTEESQEFHQKRDLEEAIKRGNWIPLVIDALELGRVPSIIVGRFYLKIQVDLGFPKVFGKNKNLGIAFKGFLGSEITVDNPFGNPRTIIEGLKEEALRTIREGYDPTPEWEIFTLSGAMAMRRNPWVISRNKSHALMSGFSTEWLSTLRLSPGVLSLSLLGSSMDL